MVDNCLMKDTRCCFVIVKVHIPSRNLSGAIRTEINESGLKYILVTKIYDEWESYDVSHAATFSQQRVSCFPSNPALESPVSQLTKLSKWQQNPDKRYLLLEIIALNYIHLHYPPDVI